MAWSSKKLCILSNLDNVTNYLFIILYHVQHQFIGNAPLIRMKVPEQNPIDDEHAPANQDDRDEHAPSDRDEHAPSDHDDHNDHAPSDHNDRDEHAPADQDDRDYDSDNTKDPEVIFFLIIISVAQI